MSEHLALTGIPRIVELEKALAPQPGVQIDTAVEGGKTVIGHYDNGRISGLVEHGADFSVDSLIGFEEFRFMPAPQHMRVLIDLRKIEEQQPVAELSETIAQQQAVFAIKRSGSARDIRAM
jgi:hypothetical protein